MTATNVIALHQEENEPTPEELCGIRATAVRFRRRPYSLMSTDCRSDLRIACRPNSRLAEFDLSVRRERDSAATGSSG